MMIGLVYALTIPGAVVTPAGYEEALAWDEHQAQRQASIKLGWSLSAKVHSKAELNGDRRVTFLLRDKQGELVDDSTLQIELYPYTRANHRVIRQLSSNSPGTFNAVLPLRRAGSWNMYAIALRGTDRFIVESDLWVESPLGLAQEGLE